MAEKIPLEIHSMGVGEGLVAVLKAESETGRSKERSCVVHVLTEMRVHLPSQGFFQEGGRGEHLPPPPPGLTLASPPPSPPLELADL